MHTFIACPTYMLIYLVVDRFRKKIDFESFYMTITDSDSSCFIYSTHIGFGSKDNLHGFLHSGT